MSWCLLLCTALLAYAAPVNIDAIDKATYDNLVKYAKFAAAAYETNNKCKKPLGLGVDNGPALRVTSPTTPRCSSAMIDFGT